MAPHQRPRSIRTQFLSPVLPVLRALCDLFKKSKKEDVVIGGVAFSILDQALLPIDIDATVMIVAY